MSRKNTKIKKIGGYLHKINIIRDSKGNVIDHIVTPLRVEIRLRDILQIIVGASILAIPVGMTEETWNLGNELPFLNVIILSLIGMCFIALFVYFNYYFGLFKEHKMDFLQRIISIYILSLFVVAIFLTIIQKAPWLQDTTVAVKRLLIITFPCSMSATISDVIK